MNLSIVGLGLMGGSLAARSRQKFPKVRVTGITRNPTALHTALQKKWIHSGSRDLKSGVASADLIILCTPVDTLKSFLLKLDRFAKPGAIVTDVGSVKGEIVRWASRRKWKRIRFVGAHPMAGSHARGIQAASLKLYDHGFTFVTPSRDAAATRQVVSFWKKISPHVVTMTAEKHDQIVSQISHLPHALAACLVLAVDPKSFPFSASGFSDTTRVAQGDPSIWAPIFMANRRSILLSLKHFRKVSGMFEKALLRRDSLAIERLLAKAAQKRRQVSL